MSSETRALNLCKMHNKLQKIKNSYKVVTAFQGENGVIFCANLQKNRLWQKKDRKKQR